jgi:hypothetical protein
MLNLLVGLVSNGVSQEFRRRPAWFFPLQNTPTA